MLLYIPHGEGRVHTNVEKGRRINSFRPCYQVGRRGIYVLPPPALFLAAFTCPDFTNSLLCRPWIAQRSLRGVLAIAGRKNGATRALESPFPHGEAEIGTWE